MIMLLEATVLLQTDRDHTMLGHFSPDSGSYRGSYFSMAGLLIAEMPPGLPL